MHERRSGGGPSWGLLLLIPAAVIIAKGVSHRRAMWRSAWAEPGTAGPGFGHHARFGRGEWGPDAGAFRLPPKIEWMLDSWHTRAHEKDQPAETSAV